MRIGYFLSCEEYGVQDLLEQAVLAQRAGFEALWISDHYHPWTDEQGESAFVWSVIGALSQAVDLPVATAVTCPTTRLGPAIVAQAAATAQVMLRGRFRLGVGTGEALNEHIHGQAWPAVDERLDMLEEAVAVMRELWTGEPVEHRGPHYTVDRARIYTRWPTAPEVYVSSFGPTSAHRTVAFADGLTTTSIDDEVLPVFRDAAKPLTAGYKVGWAPTEEEGVDHAHRLWASSGLPGELAQVLPTPAHIEQASSLVSREATRESAVCGPDVDRHVQQVTRWRDAGFDEVYVANMGPHFRDMIRAYGDEVLPRVRAA
ncbi:MAG: TIGR03557 family F420-dependent LLM class oxidoreductase [Frankiales bacterium]|nr:TIGR03557 family F420-dependent LLM class oxidoreductase [Frankiales bacterium]